MSVPDWEARYQAGTTGWQRSEINPAFLAWRADGTLSPGRILVPGAGRSAEPMLLAEAGFAVTVVDLAPTAVAFQQQRLAPHGGRAVLADLLHWEPDDLQSGDRQPGGRQPGAAFDAIYDQTCLCALPPALWNAYAARLLRWLRPGGVLAALFMQTHREGGPPFHCDLARMRTLYPPAAWAWPAVPAAPVAHHDGLSEQPAALIRLNADASDAWCAATPPG